MTDYLINYRRTRRPGYVAGIQPAVPPESFDTTNLTVWLKDAGLTGLGDNDPVSTWADSSGNGLDAIQGTAAYRPLYKTNILNGYPVVRFDGSDDYLDLGDISGHFGSVGSLFVVCYLNSASLYNIYTSLDASDTWWRYDSDGNGYMGVFRSARIEGYPATMPTSGWHIMTLISGVADYIFYLDTVSKGTQAAAFVAGSNHRIGYRRWLKGDVAELLVYSDDKSPTRAEIETYLKAKFNL